MSSELVPQPKVLMSDAERERVVSQLHTAVGEGRLTLGEFEDRISGVLAARTFADVEPYVADLPKGLHQHAPAGPVDLNARGSKIVRTGRWAVPSKIRVQCTGSSALLDFTAAIVTTSVVEMEVEMRGSSLKLIVPEGTSVDAQSTSMVGSSVKVRKVPEYAYPGQSGVHIVITGSLRGSSIKASPPRVWFWQKWFRRTR